VRRRATVGGALASLGILIGGWEVGVLASPTSSSATASGSGTSTSSGVAADTTADATTSGTSPSTASDGTWTGSAVSTRWGDVQVQVVISGGAITDVIALQLTDKDHKSVQISNRAAPVLRSEVLAAQSADVANVSGATYTSDAYLQSLQSALDQAGL
jgi:uncharacterized protein with FMN-binding domain